MVVAMVPQMVYLVRGVIRHFGSSSVGGFFVAAANRKYESNDQHLDHHIFGRPNHRFIIAQKFEAVPLEESPDC